MKTSLFAAAAFAALLVSAATVAHAADPVTIDAFLALSGPGSFLGKGEQQALELVEKAVNASGGIKGRTLKFAYHDDQTNPQTAVQLAGEVLANKPSVVLGSSLVATCRAIGPLMKNGPVDYCFSPGIHPEQGSYVFTASASTIDLANSVVRYFRLKGWTKLALMFSTDASGQDAEAGVKGVLALPENKDMTVTATAHFNTTDVSVSAQIEQIKASNAQGLIAWSTGAPVGTIFRGLVQGGVDIPTATTDGNMTYAQMTQYAAFLPKQLFIPASQWIVRDPAQLAPEVAAKNKEFYKYYEDAKVQPDIASELGWEPAMIVVHALQTLGPEATAQQVRDFIAHLKGFAGVNGIYDFEKSPQRGLDVSDTVVTRWSPEAKTWQVVSKPTGIPLQ